MLSKSIYYDITNPRCKNSIIDRSLSGFHNCECTCENISTFTSVTNRYTTEGLLKNKISNLNANRAYYIIEYYPNGNLKSESYSIRFDLFYFEHFLKKDFDFFEYSCGEGICIPNLPRSPYYSEVITNYSPEGNLVSIELLTSGVSTYKHVFDNSGILIK